MDCNVLTLSVLEDGNTLKPLNELVGDTLKYSVVDNDATKLSVVLEGDPGNSVGGSKNGSDSKIERLDSRVTLQDLSCIAGGSLKYIESSTDAVVMVFVTCELDELPVVVA